MTTALWCLQCGEENRPEKAIGVDEDGEPACRMHAKTITPVHANDLVRTQTPAKSESPPREMSEPMRKLKPAPLCKCGCGELVTERYGNGSGGWKTYIDGHKKSKSARGGGVERKAPRKSKRSAAQPDQGVSTPLGRLKADLLAQLAAIETVEALLAKGSAAE